MKPRVKVYELAQDLGRRSQEVLRAAADLGIFAQNRLTRLDPESVSRLRNHFRERDSEDGSGSNDAAPQPNETGGSQ